MSDEEKTITLRVPYTTEPSSLHDGWSVMNAANVAVVRNSVLLRIFASDLDDAILAAWPEAPATDHAKRLAEIEAWAARNEDTASIEDAGVGDLTEEIAIGVEAVRDLLAQLRAASEALTAAGVPDDGRPLAERIRFLREDATGRRRDEVLAVIDGWVGHYPADVFPPDGTSIDAKSGTFARHLLGLVRGQLVKVFDGGEDPGIAAATERCARGEHRKGGEYSGNSCADCGTDFGDLDTEPTPEDLARGAAVFAQMGSREATIARLAERDPAFAADVAWLNLDPASTERHWQGAMALLRARGVNVDTMLAQAAKNLEGVTPEVARPRAASVHGPVDPGLDVEEPARRGVEQAEGDGGDPGSEGAHDGSIAAASASRKENRQENPFGRAIRTMHSKASLEPQAGGRGLSPAEAATRYPDALVKVKGTLAALGHDPDALIERLKDPAFREAFNGDLGRLEARRSALEDVIDRHEHADPPTAIPEEILREYYALAEPIRAAHKALLGRPRIHVVDVAPLSTVESMAFVDGPGLHGVAPVKTHTYPESPRGKAVQSFRRDYDVSLGDVARALCIGADEMSGIERGSKTTDAAGWKEILTACFLLGSGTAPEHIIDPASSPAFQRAMARDDAPEETDPAGHSPEAMYRDLAGARPPPEPDLEPAIGDEPTGSAS